MEPAHVRAARELPADEPTLSAWADVFAIFSIEDRPEGMRVVACEGTGFRLGRDVFVTCWHCVADENHRYMLSRGEVDPASGGAVLYPLHHVAQDTNGSDLATAKLDDDLSAEPSRMHLRLAVTAATAARSVWTLGYPLPSHTRGVDGKGHFKADARILRGYVTRSFTYQHLQDGPTPSYELDMPAPEGLSGAPLMLDPGTNVIGVVYGSNDVGRIEQFARFDTETGERRPEVERMVSFGLAHFTSRLHALRGPATDNEPLVEYLKRTDPV